ncbi:MAG: ABC transporter permease [Gemmatimonadetes bacterium]|nr:ABC transporter permease [Gemmatimonadota bacterium]
MMDALAPFLDASVRTATPLALAALGETLCERTGIINVGLEGAIIAGCLGAVIGSAAFGAPAGVLVAAGAGLAVALLFGVIVLVARADQIITGTAITLGAYGATGVLYPLFFGPGGAALDIPTLGPMALPFLSQLPLVGPALFGQSILTYLLYAGAGGAWWFLYRTGAGLGWRAVGEHAPAATAAGIDVRRVQWRGVLCSGVFGGLGGAALVMQVGTFSEQMSAGRGFIALAVVALGRWSPHGALAAALLFGAATALQYRFQAGGSTLPYQLFVALPYLVTLAVLAGGLGRARAPGGLGREAASDR